MRALPKNCKNALSRKTMAQRWLGTTLLNAEKKFRRILGYLGMGKARKKYLEQERYMLCYPLQRRLEPQKFQLK